MIDVDGIINILNIVLIVLFSLTIAGIVIAFVRGLFRGFWKSTFYLGWYGTLLAISFLTLGPLIDAVGNLDLTEAGLFVNMTSETGTFSIPVTTVKETLHQTIALSLTLNGMAGSAADISTAAWSISVMVLKYALYLVDVILIVILGTFFGWLLWALIFKHFIPKIVRKRVKLRVISALEGMVTFTVLTGLFLAPFTSLVNIANQAWQKNRDPDNQTETMKTIDRFMETYNDSLFAKTFFNWTVNDQGLTLDSAVINDITKTTVGDMETSIVETIDGLGQVGVAIAGAFTIGENQTVVDMGYILSEKTLTNLFDGINKSQIFAYTLPLVATLALNVDQVKEYVDPNLINLSDVDWLKEIENVETLTIDVINSGVVDSFINKNGEPTDAESEKSGDVKDIINSMLTESAYPYFTRIFSSIDQSKLLSRVIPSVMMHVSESVPEMADMMPKTWEEMNQLKWGSELNIVYDNLFRLNRTAPDMVEVLTTMGGGSATEEPQPKTILYKDTTLKADEPGSGEPVTPDTTPDVPGTTPEEPGSTPETPSEPTPSQDSGMLDVLIDNIDPLTQALVGEFDDNGKIANIDNQGHTIVYDAAGKKIPGRHYTLMDSALFSYALPNLMDTLTKSMGEGDNAFIKPETMEKATNKLKSGVVLANYKNELAALFTAFKGVAENPDLKNIITGGGSEGLMDKVKDQKFVNKLVNLMPAFKNSEIFKLAVEPLLTEQITNQDEMLSNIGLTAKRITDQLDKKKEELSEDEYYDYFFDEMAYILKSMPNLLSVTDIMSDSGDATAMFDNLTANSAKLTLLLDTIYDSDILNPSENRKSTDTEINNFFAILEHLFGGDKPIVDGMTINFDNLEFVGDATKINAHGSGVHGWTSSKTVDGGFLTDAHGRPIFDGENGYIANALVSLGAKAKHEYPAGSTDPMYSQGQTLVSVLTDDKIDISQVIGRLEQDFGISQVFAKVDNSSLMGQMLGTFMDSREALKGTGITENGNGFSNIKDWTTEGRNFGIICDSIDLVGMKLDELDVSKIKDMESLNMLLHSLADSQIFETRDSNTYRYNFNAFLYDKLASAYAKEGSDANSDMLCDPYTRSPEKVRTYKYAMTDFDVDPETKTSIIVEEASKKPWVQPEWMNTFGSYSHDKEGLKSLLKSPENYDQFYNDDHIGRICAILDKLNTLKTNAAEAGKGDNTFNPDDIGQLMSSGYAKTEDLENVLQSIYKCEPARMILYNAIVSIGNIEMSEVSLKQVNPDFFLKVLPITGEVNEKLVLDAEDGNSKEISKIINIYTKLDIIKDQIDSMKKKNPTIAFNDILNNILSTKENMVLLKEILQEVHDSECFNLFGKSVVDYNEAEKIATYSKQTVFQTLVNKFILSDMILQVLFSVDSPKDQHFFNDYVAYANEKFVGEGPKITHTIDALTNDELKKVQQAKGEMILEKNFFVPGTNEDDLQTTIGAQNDEISRIVEITASLLGGYKDVDKLGTKISPEKVVTVHSYTDHTHTALNEKTYEEELNELSAPQKSAKIYTGLKDKTATEDTNTMDFNRMDFKKVDGNVVKGIMEALNKSNCLYDLAPNGLATILSSFGGNAAGEGGDDFFARTLKKANPYYIYDLADKLPDYKGEAKWEIRFYDSEIKDEDYRFKNYDGLEFDKLYTIVDEYNKLIKSSGGDNLGNIFADGLTDDVLGLANTVLTNLNESYMFHQCKTLTDFIKFKNRNEETSSSFEFLYAEFFIRTGVSDIVDEIKDLPTPEKKREQVFHRIINKSAEDAILTFHINAPESQKNAAVGKNTWKKEIQVLMKLGKCVKELNFNKMDSLSIDLKNPTYAEKLSPENVSTMLAYLNWVDTAEGSINGIVKSAYDSAGFNRFTVYNGDKNAANYNLTQAQYGCKISSDGEYKAIIPENDPTSEISVIKRLLTELSETKDGKHTGYVTLSAKDEESPINVFVTNGKSTSVLLNFLHDSSVYKNAITDINGLTGKQIKTESLFFYNMMEKADLTQFITGDGINKLLTINHIITTEGLYEPINEAKALDILVNSSAAFTDTNADAFEFNKMQEKKYTIEAVIASTSVDVLYDKVTHIYTITEDAHNRSYLTSEILSNVLDKFMAGEINQIITTYGHDQTVDVQETMRVNITKTFNKDKNNINNINADSYSLLNPHEAHAITAILECYENNTSGLDMNSPVGISGATRKFIQAMYNYNHSSNPAVGVEPMNWDEFMYKSTKEANTYIAGLIYTARINPLFDTLFKAMNNSTMQVGYDGFVKDVDAKLFKTYGAEMSTFIENNKVLINTLYPGAIPA